MITKWIRLAASAAAFFVALTAPLSYCQAQSKIAVATAVSTTEVEANRKLVLDFWRVVIEGHDLDAADQYCAPDFVQHNPLMSNGIASMLERFKLMSKDAAKKVEPTLRNPPAEVMADGDLVLLMWRRPTPEPTDPAKTYDRYSFDLYRVQNHKIVEHWDGAVKPAS